VDNVSADFEVEAQTRAPFFHLSRYIGPLSLNIRISLRQRLSACAHPVLGTIFPVERLLISPFQYE
jgi:hypothetical protein